MDASTTPAGTVRTLERGLSWHAGVMMAATGAAAVSSWGGLLAVPAALSFASLRRGHTGVERPRARIGLANVLTASRLAILLSVAAAIPWVSAPWVLAAFGYNVAMDVADGYVARSRDEVTPFGAMFDREVDAVFVLVAYFYFYSSVGFGAWVILPGLLPYLYRLAVTLLSAPIPADQSEPLARVLAGVNFVLLLVAVAAAERATPIVIVSVLVVTVSFGGSFVSLFRNARSPA